MTKAKGSPIINFYFFSLVLLMLKSMGVCWLWPIPPLFFNIFSALTTVFVFASSNIFYKKKDNCLMCITIIYIMIIVTKLLFGASHNFVGNLIVYVIHPIVILGVLFLKDEFKFKLFKWFVSTLSIILFISIPAWILYLIGVPFPRGPLHDAGDGFHFIYSYRFFIISYNSVGALFPRFASIFMEPGWIGMVCCFVLFGVQFNTKKIITYLCAFAIVLSMSLSAVVNLIVCGFLWIVLNSKHRFIYVFLFISIIISIGAFAINYNNGNNVINARIVERLAFDEDLGIAGNNRSNETLDYYLEDVLGSSSRWFGIMSQIDSDFSESNDWYNHSSGIKKSLLTNGIIGFGLLLLFFSSLLCKYRCKKSFVFYVCFLMASFVRDLWTTDCYIILYILTLSILHYSLKEERFNERIS